MWKREIFEHTVKLTFIARSNIPCLNTAVAPISNIPTRLTYKFYCAHFPRLCARFTEGCEDTKLCRFCTDNKNVSSSVITYNEVTYAFTMSHVWIDWSRHWLIHWLTDWPTDWFYWLIGWLRDWLICWLVDLLTDHTYGLSDWLADRLIWMTNWLADWLIGWLIYWLVDWLIDLLIDWLTFGFDPLGSRCTWALINGPFVPQSYVRSVLTICITRLQYWPVY